MRDPILHTIPGFLLGLRQECQDSKFGVNSRSEKIAALVVT